MAQKIYEMPPMLGRSTEQNVAEIRAFLVRLVRELEQVESSGSSESNGSLKVSGGKKTIESGSGGPAKQKSIQEVMQQAAELKQLIIKTANDLGDNITDGDSYVMNYTNTQIDGLNAQIEQTYVAQSEFGTFVEQVDRQIENTAKATVESYGYSSLISSAQQTADQANLLIQQYSTVINGQIRRGLITDPDTGLDVLGIAISQNLQFTGEITKGDDGYEYYRLETGQTFGMYTSTGWQFWIDGFKKGWYNSMDGMLHIANVYIENILQFGTTAQFVVDGTGRFGLKRINT